MSKAKRKPYKTYSEVIFMPNEIFKDFSDIEQIQHRALLYSYYYMVSYLYRYCKYLGDKEFTQKEIKQFLGYNPDNKKIDFLIKNGGILDTKGYTKTITDIPIFWNYTKEEGILEFDTVESLKSKGYEKSGNLRGYKIKYPIKAFERNVEDDDYDVGTFFDAGNTHKISFNRFKSIIQTETLGAIGFYIYGYIKFKSDKFNGRYQASIEQLASELNINRNSVIKYMKELETSNFINIVHVQYVHGKIGNQANSYSPKQDF